RHAAIDRRHAPIAWRQLDSQVVERPPASPFGLPRVRSYVANGEETRWASDREPRAGPTVSLAPSAEVVSWAGCERLAGPPLDPGTLVMAAAQLPGRRGAPPPDASQARTPARLEFPSAPLRDPRDCARGR